MPFDVEILEEVFAHHAENLLALAVGLLSFAESEIRIDDLFDALAVHHGQLRVAVNKTRETDASYPRHPHWQESPAVEGW